MTTQRGDSDRLTPGSPKRHSPTIAYIKSSRDALGDFDRQMIETSYSVVEEDGIPKSWNVAWSRLKERQKSLQDHCHRTWPTDWQWVEHIPHCLTLIDYQPQEPIKALQLS